uniref:Peptidase S1 domain-containing protein n=1 Tax=Chrysemys picta bellii TaxID=8478 RepID=A0A8C3FS27_CHRPI
RSVTGSPTDQLLPTPTAPPAHQRPHQSVSLAPPQISGRIVGGGDAPRGRWPWQVSVQHNGHHFCGGQTSYPAAFLAKFAIRLIILFSTIPRSDLVSSYRIFVHPNYSSTWKSADIALLQLTEPVRYTNEILPVCLPGPSDSFPDNHVCWVTGWGRIDSVVSLPPPKTLQEVQVQLIDTAACNALYNINPAPNIGRDPVKPDMICAGYDKGQKDSCQGDSGGPLACDHNGTWFLMGIVSWGEGCGQPNHPGVYVRTVAYGEWIWEHIGSGSQGWGKARGAGELRASNSPGCRAWSKAPGGTGLQGKAAGQNLPCL